METANEIDAAETGSLVAKFSVVRALTVLGDAWTLLILRSAFHGTRRFSDWQADLGVPKAVLANRLDRLVGAGVLYRRTTSDGGRRMEYRLGEAGLDLWEPLVAVYRWANRWQYPDGRERLWFRHSRCGHACDLILSCDTCAGELTPFNTIAEPGPGAGLEQRVLPHARRRANSAMRHGERYLGSAEALGMFGDMWSPVIVASAFRGIRRFNDLAAYTRLPPLVLSMRLKELQAIGVLQRKLIDEGGRFEAFQLTRKGLDLFPYIATLAKWGDRWCDDGTGVPLVFHHRTCSHEYAPVYRCSHCGGRVHRSEIVQITNPR